MAKRQITMPETTDSTLDTPTASLSQRRRPELGRFLLQVDRQTKRSYASAEDASTAGLAIKKSYPIVSVAVYDSVDNINTPIQLPT